MYTIKHASLLTGVAEATLRAWERRYALVSPQRSEAGYRLYDKEAVARILAMRRLVDAGWAPAEAARAVRDGDVPTSAADPTDTGDVPAGAAPHLRGGRAAALAAMEGFLRSAAAMDVDGVEDSLDRGFALGSFEHVVENWLFPTLTALGEAWANGSIDVAGEHMASHAVHRRLAAAYAASGRRHHGPVVAVGLPPGSRHELGALAFATALQRLGLNALFLGADVPTRSWLAVVRKPKVVGAVLAVVCADDCGPTAETIAQLRAERPEDLLIGVGGRYACQVGHDVEELPSSIAAAADRIEAAVRG